MRTLLITLSILIFTISCSQKKDHIQLDKLTQLSEVNYTVQYAKGFSVDLYDNYKVVTVRNPWDTTKILQRYVLVNKSIDIPLDLPEGIVVRTPLSNVVAYSSIHSSSLNELNKQSSIKGICEPEYVSIPFILDGIKNGNIVDLGQASNPNVEKIIEIDPDAIWTTPIEGQTYGNVLKTGIPIIETPDYMEPTPLGRAEWLRFYSLFYDNESFADSLFQQTVENYNKIKDKVVSVKDRPTVFNDLMYRGVWYISGGDSFMARMYHDAGAKYVWEDDNRNTSNPYSFEQVLNDAGNAQFWLIKYNNMDELTYSKLGNEYKPYSYFDAFRKKNVFVCNTIHQTYYEDLPIHPDYILQDFAYIFHPELFPDYTLRYFLKMRE